MTAIIYTQPGCGPCAVVKKMFADSGLEEGTEYQVRDITESLEDLHFIKEILGAKSVPVVTGSDGTVVIGYQHLLLAEIIDGEIGRRDGFDWNGTEEDGRWLH